MIHPQTELKMVSPEIGYGVFATADIPKGTITYVKDAMEIEVSPRAYKGYSGVLKDQIDRYSYIDQRGYRIISWDFAKYVNHCCQCNSMSTGYGFEIAIRDIKAGEQITDEYGIFNLDMPMEVNCGQLNCRKRLEPADFDLHYKQWDKLLKNPLSQVKKVDQPLFPLLNQETVDKLEAYLKDRKAYNSVYKLRYMGKPPRNRSMRSNRRKDGSLPSIRPL